jgi:fermentation-respiration switch protein FrsA (DUF1100 family)
MAHGFSAVRDQRLDAYAERFADAGLACVVFDYRHFGASEGEPRQLLDISRQLEDWRAAVAFARGLDGIDPERIGLYRPYAKLDSVRASVLVFAADGDETTPPTVAIRAAERAPNAELVRVPLGHFDLYVDEPFERAVATQADFLSRHLVRVPEPAAT